MAIDWIQIGIASINVVFGIVLTGFVLRFFRKMRAAGATLWQKMATSLLNMGCLIVVSGIFAIVLELHGSGTDLFYAVTIIQSVLILATVYWAWRFVADVCDGIEDVFGRGGE